METCRFLDPGRYIPAGQTRSSTKTTVQILGHYSAHCCPFTEVDKELDYICTMSKVSRDHFSRTSLLNLSPAMDQILAQSIRYGQLDAPVACEMPSFRRRYQFDDYNELDIAAHAVASRTATDALQG